MKNDIDFLMEQHGVDVMLVTGAAQHNADMYYFSGSGHVTAAELIKKRGEAPVLFHNPMERDEAAKSGLQTKSLGSYNLKQLMDDAGGNLAKAFAARYKTILTELGITSGRLAVYGQTALGPAYATLSELQKMMPELTIIGESGDTVLLKARATKDEEEIERIRRMGQITTAVVGQVAEYLSSHRAKDGLLVKADGEPLTIGQVKRQIDLWLIERGAENPKGAIFAIGRDAGVPHSSGNAGDFLRLGETIVFDIFPCEAGGGYFYDFTRTWCLGFAPEPVQALYADVYSVYNEVMSELKANTACYSYQKRTCELFEARGHKTVESNPGTLEGYVHSLGHGLGLDIHESPWFGSTAPKDSTLKPGVVVTIEPGLYYPERGMGCRLEDTVWVRPDGEMEVLADYPLDLVLPVKN